MRETDKFHPLLDVCVNHLSPTLQPLSIIITEMKERKHFQ